MMREISKWLLHDDQKELFEIIFAVISNILFLILIALLLWTLDRAALVFDFAKGYGILWVTTFIAAVLIDRIQQIFKVNIYDHSDVFLVSNLLASCILQAGWAAFAALSIFNSANGSSGWVRGVLYIVGGFSCIVAFYIVSSFYQGHFYRLISLPLALVSFVVFSGWPASGHALYGWFFDLF